MIEERERLGYNKRRTKEIRGLRRCQNEECKFLPLNRDKNAAINIGYNFQRLFRGEEASTTSHSYHLAIPYGIHWRIFWLLLNTSYVMEFFLQTLVKRKILSQGYMLVLQKILMLAASLSAIKVLFGSDGEPAVVRPEICLLSLTLNFIHRHHEVLNTIGIALAFCVLDSVL